MTGRASKPVRKGSENRRLFVGNYKAPIAIIKRGDIKSYIDADFYSYYECWKVLNSGMGLPYGPGWSKYPELFVYMMTIFSSEWEALTGNK